MFSTLTNKQTNSELDNCEFIKITATCHTTNEIMFSSLVVREVPSYRAVTINMHPPQVICTERTQAASVTVIFNTICV